MIASALCVSLFDAIANQCQDLRLVRDYQPLGQFLEKVSKLLRRMWRPQKEMNLKSTFSSVQLLTGIYGKGVSLTGVEPLMQKTHNQIRVVDAEILAVIRQQ
ncbi:hypothetical protein Tco_0718626, partial [Tanacetum coccineum]